MPGYKTKELPMEETGQGDDARMTSFKETSQKNMNLIVASGKTSKPI